MGDRYFIQVACPKCKFFDGWVYYAPTCAFNIWICPMCGNNVNLEDYTGISYEDASNKDEIAEIVKATIKKSKKTPNPGSDEAINQGCTCPVLDNYHGQGIGTSENGDKLFWYSVDCPIHQPANKKTEGQDMKVT